MWSRTGLEPTQLMSVGDRSEEMLPVPLQCWSQTATCLGSRGLPPLFMCRALGVHKHGGEEAPKTSDEVLHQPCLFCWVEGGWGEASVLGRIQLVVPALPQGSGRG